MCVCMCTMNMPGACGRQKRLSGPLGFKLQMGGEPKSGTAFPLSKMGPPAPRQVLCQHGTDVWGAVFLCPLVNKHIML